MLNNKGFTIVELIMSFTFVSILSASLFAVVVNYNEKHDDFAIKSRLLSFKSKLLVDVQKDIQTKILDEIAYCVDDTGKVISKCVNFIYKDGDVKKFEVKQDVEEDSVDVIVNGNNHSEKFRYVVPYISYGGIKYTIPDGSNIVVNNSYLLQHSRPEDGVENGMTVYKVYVDLEHVDIDVDIDISIVATGNKFITDGTASQYGEYKIGDRVRIQLGSEKQTVSDITKPEFDSNGERWFRVLKDSSTYENRLILLADFMVMERCDATGSNCYIDYGTNPGSVPYSSLDVGNDYNLSFVKDEVEKLSITHGWNNPDVVRLPLAEEIGYLVYACPKYAGETEVASDIFLPTTPYTWIYDNTANYWTMTPTLITDPAHADKNAWYVNTSTKAISSSYIDATTAGIRPVIEIRKDFVLEHVSS